MTGVALCLKINMRVLYSNMYYLNVQVSDDYEVGIDRVN